MLFSSQLVGVYKPERRNYEWVMGVLGLEPRECVTVAAHTSDLKGAREVGMRTVYVRLVDWVLLKFLLVGRKGGSLGIWVGEIVY